MAFFLLLTGCRGRTCPALNFAVIALERVVYFYAAGRACPAPTEQPFRVMRRAGCPHPAAAAWGRPPYRLPYSRCSFITASTSGGSTSGHCSRGIFPLRMSLDAQG